MEGEPSFFFSSSLHLLLHCSSHYYLVISPVLIFSFFPSPCSPLYSVIFSLPSFVNPTSSPLCSPLHLLVMFFSPLLICSPRCPSVCLVIETTFPVALPLSYRFHYCSRSTGIFIFLYAVFFYWKSGMSGDLQASFFFGRTLLVCFMFSIMLGAVGSISSLLFIREIYNNLKLD